MAHHIRCVIVHNPAETRYPGHTFGFHAPCLRQSVLLRGQLVTVSEWSVCVLTYDFFQTSLDGTLYPGNGSHKGEALSPSSDQLRLQSDYLIARDSRYVRIVLGICGSSDAHLGPCIHGSRSLVSRSLTRSSSSRFQQSDTCVGRRQRIGDGQCVRSGHGEAFDPRTERLDARGLLRRHPCLWTSLGDIGVSSLLC